MRIDWYTKLRVLLQVLAFCLAVAAVQYAFRPDRPYEIPLVYSLCIGLSAWALIDFGRHALPSSAETGWPRGSAIFVLILGGILCGYGLGTLAGDAWFGWSTWKISADGNSKELFNSLLIALVAGLAAGYYFHNEGKNAELERRMSELHRQSDEARLRLLESQLEPHMLFNTLANLRALIAADPAQATSMLDRIIAYLRATLAASRSASHPLQAEFERLRDYLELMAVRMGPRLRYTLDLPAELATQPVPALLLQPLVENSLQHGLEPQVQGGEVSVRAWLEAEALQLEVADTGIGPEAAAQHDEATAHAGFGLAQVRERLATAYGPAAQLRFAARPEGGCRVHLTLPLT